MVPVGYELEDAMTQGDLKGPNLLGGSAAAVLLLLLAGCGGGGDGTTTDDPAGGTRQASISFDLDNNGVADAQETLRYDSEGRLTQRAYVYTGDAVADRMDGRGQGAVTETFGYDGQSRMSSFGTTSSEGAVSMSFVYDSGELPTRADVSAAGMVGQRNYVYDTAGLLQRVDLLIQGQLFGSTSFEHDAQGRRSLAAESDPAGSGVARTRYTWNADGSLAAVARDIDADGFDVAYSMTYENGRQATTRKSVAGQVLYSVRFAYDSQGRIERATIDMGSDGSDDAVMTVTWEAGACRSVRLPEFDPLLDSVTGWGSSATGRLSHCGS